MIKLIKRILTNEILYVSEKDIYSCVNSVFGGCGAELLMKEWKELNNGRRFHKNSRRNAKASNRLSEETFGKKILKANQT